MRAVIQEHLDKVNEKFARVEQVKKFEILPHDLSQETRRADADPEGQAQRRRRQVRDRTSRRSTPSFLVAPDSFKGTLSARQVAEAIGRGLEDAGAMADLCPVADGGEGTMEILVNAWAVRRGQRR